MYLYHYFQRCLNFKAGQLINKACGDVTCIARCITEASPHYTSAARGLSLNYRALSHFTIMCECKVVLTSNYTGCF